MNKMQQPAKIYIVWDYWCDSKTYYAIYEKEIDGKLYFSEANIEKTKLLEHKKKKVNFLKRIFKWIKE